MHGEAPSEARCYLRCVVHLGVPRLDRLGIQGPHRPFEVLQLRRFFLSESAGTLITA